MRKTANNLYHELFDSAYNEYLHTLVTVGMVGLAAYSVFVFTFIKRCFKKGKSNPYVIDSSGF